MMNLNLYRQGHILFCQRRIREKDLLPLLTNKMYSAITQLSGGLWPTSIRNEIQCHCSHQHSRNISLLETL